MVQNELLDALIKINNSRDFKIPANIIDEVLTAVIKYPLPEDRGECQEKIKYIIIQKWGKQE